MILNRNFIKRGINKRTTPKATKTEGPSALGKAFDAPGDVLSKGTDLALGISSSFGKHERAYHNFYTGFKPSKRLTVAGTAAFAAYGYGSTQLQVKNPEKPGEVTYVGNAPALQADAVQRTTNAPTLGANGSMVFGLNSMRRG